MKIVCKSTAPTVQCKVGRSDLAHFAIIGDQFNSFHFKEQTAKRTFEMKNCFNFFVCLKMSKTGLTWLNEEQNVVSRNFLLLKSSKKTFPLVQT